MITLGIETSCDDTSLAIHDDSSGILGSVTFSQADIHTRFGGIIPEVASRNHIIKLRPLFDDLLEKTGKSVQDIDLIGVTNQPGLIGALFTGFSFAKGLGYALRRPVIAVNHLTAHILAAELAHPELQPPYAALIVSGGHTHVYVVDEALNFTLLARTVDDAAGEAFDKVSKMLGGPYPGGPFIERTAREGNEKALRFPVAMRQSDDYSFSGLKTAVLNAVQAGEHSREDIAAAFQNAVARTLTEKAIRSAKAAGQNVLIVAGGVACNGYLRDAFSAADAGVKVYFPTPRLCMDNGDMVAYTAYRMYRRKKFASLGEDACDTAYIING